MLAGRLWSQRDASRRGGAMPSTVRSDAVELRLLAHTHSARRM